MSLIDIGRDKLTPQEEIKTKHNAKTRNHVDRIIERMKTQTGKLI